MKKPDWQDWIDDENDWKQDWNKEFTEIMTGISEIMSWMIERTEMITGMTEIVAGRLKKLLYWQEWLKS